MTSLDVQPIQRGNVQPTRKPPERPEVAEPRQPAAQETQPPVRHLQNAAEQGWPSREQADAIRATSAPQVRPVHLQSASEPQNLYAPAKPLLVARAQQVGGISQPEALSEGALEQAIQDKVNSFYGTNSQQAIEDITARNEVNRAAEAQGQSGPIPLLRDSNARLEVAFRLRIDPRRQTPDSLEHEIVARISRLGGASSAESAGKSTEVLKNENFNRSIAWLKRQAEKYPDRQILDPNKTDYTHGDMLEGYRQVYTLPSDATWADIMSEWQRQAGQNESAAARIRTEGLSEAPRDYYSRIAGLTQQPTRAAGETEKRIPEDNPFTQRLQGLLGQFAARSHNPNQPYYPLPAQNILRQLNELNGNPGLEASAREAEQTRLLDNLDQVYQHHQFLDSLMGRGGAANNLSSSYPQVSEHLRGLLQRGPEPSSPELDIKNFPIQARQAIRRMAGIYNNPELGDEQKAKQFEGFQNLLSQVLREHRYLDTALSRDGTPYTPEDSLNHRLQDLLKQGRREKPYEIPGLIDMDDYVPAIQSVIRQLQELEMPAVPPYNPPSLGEVYNQKQALIQQFHGILESSR